MWDSGFHRYLVLAFTLKHNWGVTAMDDPNIFFIGIFIMAIFLCGIWLTVSDFKNIGDHKTDRRKHIDEDMKVDN